MHSDLFEKYVTEAIDNIPEPYASKIKDVVFQVEDAPAPKQRLELGLRRCDALFGLYQGVPLTKRGGAVHSVAPDIITIYRYPMMDMHSSIKDLKKQIYKTMWHEVAHYFGLNHERIHKAEQQSQS